MPEYEDNTSEQPGEDFVAPEESSRVEDPSTAEAMARASDSARLSASLETQRAARQDPETARVATLGASISEWHAERAEAAAALVHEWLAGWRAQLSGEARPDLRTVLEARRQEVRASYNKTSDADKGNRHREAGNLPPQLVEVSHQTGLVPFLADLDDLLESALRGESHWPPLDDKTVSGLFAKHRQDALGGAVDQEDHEIEALMALGEWYRDRWIEIAPRTEG